jgi:hypothetical protein
MIKRGIIYLIVLILISQIVFSEDVSLIKTPRNTAVIYNANQAEYAIKITNHQNTADRFRFSLPISHWDWLITTEPTALDVGAGQRETFVLKISPLFQTSSGIYLIPAKLYSRNNNSVYEEIEFEVEVITYNQTLNTNLEMPKEINPNQENIIKLNLENKHNLELKNLKVTIESDSFSVSKNINISRFENSTKSFLISFTENVEKGKHPVFVRFYSNNELVLERKYEMQIGDFKNIKAIETPKLGFLFKSEKIIKTNNGNIVLHETYTKELSYLGNLFTKTSPEPTTITKQGINYILQWDVDIGPGETITITIEKDYRKPILGVIGLIILLGLFYSYKKKDLILLKSISSIKQSKDGMLSMDIILKLKNKSRRTIKNIKLLDTIKNMIEEPSHFSDIKPKIIKTNEIKSRMLWSIPKLKGKSSFVVSYNVKVKHKRISDLKISKAIAKYLKLGRRILVHSNLIRPF